jgi:hypothetical protein
MRTSRKWSAAKLQELGRIRQPVDLVEHDALTAETPKERLGILHEPTLARKLAIEVLDVGQRLAEGGLTGAADARKPDDRARLPQSLEQVRPIGA